MESPVLHTLAGIGLDFLFPSRCALCGVPLAGHPHRSWPLCDECRETLAWNPRERCRVCGRELISEIGICMDCRTRSYDFDANYPLFPYTGRFRDTLRAYKFGGFLGLGYLFAGLLAASYRERFDGRVVVPVPFRKGKKRKTGWDQVDYLVRILAHRYGIPVSFMLRRGVSRPQKELDYRERLENLRGRITLARPFRDPARRTVECRGSAVLLVDDIFTTGATLSECARVLRAGGGVERVDALTLCID